jgi:tRNA(adenine34) deaminase
MDEIIDLHSDQYFMGEALRQAHRAWEREEVPVGAVVVHNGRIIARAFNQVETLKDATAHAEMLAITQAESAIGDWRLNECDLYVTKEPCAMCAGALVHVRMRRVVFGCASAKDGGAGGVVDLLRHPKLNHQCEVAGGIREQECAEMLKAFFRERRAEQP